MRPTRLSWPKYRLGVPAHSTWLLPASKYLPHTHWLGAKDGVWDLSMTTVLTRNLVSRNNNKDLCWLFTATWNGHWDWCGQFYHSDYVGSGAVLHWGRSNSLAQCSWNLLPSTTDFTCGIFVMWTNGTSYQVRLATVLMVSAFQAPLTIGLHFAELLCNLSRDERIFRQAATSRGTDPRYNSTSAAVKSWETISLFVIKAFIHWMFGLSINSHWAPALTMFTIQIFYCTICALLIALFATYISLRRPSGPLPATSGHLQTIADLVDEWQGD